MLVRGADGRLYQISNDTAEAVAEVETRESARVTPVRASEDAHAACEIVYIRQA